MNTAWIVYSDGERREVALCRRTERNGLGLYLSRDAIEKPAEYVDFCLEEACASEGEDGYFTVNNTLLKFVGHADGEYDTGYCSLRLLGIKTVRSCYAVIVTGLWGQHSFVFSRRDGKYSARVRFKLEGQRVDEDMSVRMVALTGNDANYSGIAKAYRDYQLHEGGCALIRDRMNADLRYVLDAPEIRVRLAWKPVPTPVEEQTLENEPPMHVAVDFERMAKVLDAFKAAGVEKAEFCLVGWNKSGHDGRWPDAFPVEEKLGGEDGLRKLLGKARDMGYRMVCHMNATDCYSISQRWSENLPMRTRDGEKQKNAQWGGGRMYNMCPVSGGEAYMMEDLPRVRELGFAGIHYIDVITCVPPRRCFAPSHPCSQKEFIQSMERIANRSKELFGGFQSEGGYDYIAPCTDMVLYTDFHMFDEVNPLIDEHIPMWQIAYHGIILNNPGTSTVNYPIKDWRSQLKFVEYGGHPAIYLHANFHLESHWMGTEDLTCGSDEEIAVSAAAVRRVYDEYQPVKDLQLETIADHRELEKDIFQTTYENGTRVICNYREEAYAVDSVVVNPHDFAVIRP